MQIIPTILSGGSGSRLWPLSRKSFPKPFIALPDGETLIQKTLRRILQLDLQGPILTVTNRDYYFLTRDAVTACAKHHGRTIPKAHYLLEPAGRNTAPAMTAAALWAQSEAGEDNILLFLPADHIIEDDQAFFRAVHQAAELAEAGFLVTFGVVPTAAETGYGYIQMGDALAQGGHKVARFVEKPNAATATDYFRSGDYLWNSGMFCMRADVLLQAMADHAPQVYAAASSAWECSSRNGDSIELGGALQDSPDLSIDYAVMEKAGNVAVVRAEFGWNDLGAWNAYGALMDVDAQNNHMMVRDSVLVDSADCVIHSLNRVTALLGVHDLLVVDTPDALLIADKARDQDVKHIVETLRSRRHESVDSHVTSYRPWGSYTVLEEGDHFKIKRIVVKPKEKLSLQMHYHRSEHWIVVSGTALIHVGGEERLIMTNESTFIPAGESHRLSNPGVIDLHLIEVQSGAYLGEDDIVRFEDIYGRALPVAPSEPAPIII
ncbi:mannose-1-phosphate guanylyltransferase/mannose-6-phosphate isomerase [Acidithiobacillus thiooxidans]|uniref:mannose-1-phosphate guanylyltransferase n=1 Tax=Acidithiobacillus thiooxidans TaxID=930 RepID=A0A1C2IQD9_ACITH|nr:mannose-1-phosphate guanylyltransferase/mannose-6-phosphate isomerase [Acidithiobacillus thiooxidans]OCX75583.1 mannose-1-phosphate guanylyltransferase/mannose-6-phosphate isomerase [Acidithiobacillus thiooxidans]OCX78233.1 mannose-1-phosphate guanylyltransferase/mannose-6-phosphate isomerase [Acidithiobacillus thiooxidans]